MINGIRFIIGSNCNYNCFYCHHEGVFKDEIDEDYMNKIDYLHKFCEKNEIYNLSITGGEPFLYEKKLKYILSKFDNEKYKFSINTNATLIKKYISYLETLKCHLEFHINVSSLQKEVHGLISRSVLYDVLMENLNLLKNTKFKICLNTILLKDINDGEVYRFIQYCKENLFTLRLLQYLPVNHEDKKYVINEIGLKRLIPNVHVGEIDSYGIFKCTLDGYNFEFVKNLCCDKLCDRCKKETYIQFNPNMDVKMCMMKDDIVKVNYNDYDAMENVLNNL